MKTKRMNKGPTLALDDDNTHLSFFLGTWLPLCVLHIIVVGPFYRQS